MSIESQKKARAERIKQEQMDSRLSSESRARSQANRRSKENVKPERPLLYELYGVMPNRWRGVLFGALLGAIVSAVLVLVVLTEAETRILGLIPLVLFPAIGLVIGASISRR